MGIDYEKLGEQTVRMAPKILKGEATAVVLTPYETISEASGYFNNAVAAELGITFAQEGFMMRSRSIDEITVE